MGSRSLTFNGNTNEWFSEIIQARQNLLLCAPNSSDMKVDLPRETSDQQIGLFTSATTGTAKCIWNSRAKLTYNAAISAREFEISGSDRLLMMAKPWHVAGISWVLMAEKIGVDYLFVPTKRGEQDQWLSAVKEYQPTRLLTVPAVLRALNKLGGWFVPNIIYGGAPVKQEDYGSLSVHTKTCYQGYGQTEAGGLISCHKINFTGSIPADTEYCYGQWPNEFDIKCEGTIEKPDSIWLHSPTAIHNGFYDTGDVGYLHNNFLYMKGRS